MAYRRGFKSEANGYAREMRGELGLDAHSPLCPWKLAAHLDFIVIPLTTYATVTPEAVAYLQSAKGQREFSAITLCQPGLRWIVHNDAHPRARQAANISHELAHGLLLHEPSALTGEDGARTFNRDQEEEAHWLGPALLISEEAALYIARTGLSAAAACIEYNVSIEVLQMRLGVTGAVRRAAYRRSAA